MDSTGGVGRRSVRFEWIGESWQVFSAQAGVWVFGAFVYGVIALIVVYGMEFALLFPVMFSSMSAGPAADPTAMTRAMMPRAWLLGIVIVLAMVVINAFFWGAMLKMANNQVRGFLLTVGDVFSGKSAFVRLLGLQLIFYIPIFLISFLTTYPMTQHLYSTASPYDPFAQMKAMMPIYEIGLALDIIPLVLLGLFWPAAALIADGESIAGALAKSWNAMKRSWLMASVFMLVFMIILWFSALLCLLGLLATVPMFMIISSLMYRDMIGMPAGQTPAPAMAGYPYQQPNPPGVWPPPPTQNPSPPPAGPEGQ